MSVTAELHEPRVKETRRGSRRLIRRLGFLSNDVVIALTVMFAVLALLTTARIRWQLNQSQTDDAHRALDVVENIKALVDSVPASQFNSELISGLVSHELERANLPSVNLMLEVEPISDRDDLVWVSVSMPFDSTRSSEASAAMCNARWIQQIQANRRPTVREVWYSASNQTSAPLDSPSSFQETQP